MTIVKSLNNFWLQHQKTIISGLLMGFAFAPFKYSFFLSYVLLVPFIDDIVSTSGFRQALAKGYWFGLFSAFSALNWVAFNTLGGYMVILLLHPWTYMLFASFFYLFWKSLKAKAIFPGIVLWTALEAARSWGQLRFPWINLNYSLSYDINFIQIIEYTGPLFLTLFIVTVNFVFWYLWRKYSRLNSLKITDFTALAVVLLIWAGVSFWGNGRISELRSNNYKVLKVGIAQPDIDAYEKWKPKQRQLAYNRLFSYSDSLADHAVDFVVWPETAIPSYVRGNISILRKVQKWSDDHQIGLLTGIPDYKATPERHFSYNAVWLVHPDSLTLDVYYKQYLVPGGETIPFKNYFSILEDVHVGGGNFWPGTEMKTLDFELGLLNGKWHDGVWQPGENEEKRLTKIRVIPAICYESIFPGLIRTQKHNNKGNLIAVITNDGWYGNSAGPYQHFQASILRAIENRTSVVRAANNGISGFFDMTGVYYEKTELFTSDWRYTYLPISTEETTYSRFGNRWLWLLCGISLIWVLYFLLFSEQFKHRVDIRSTE